MYKDRHFYFLLGLYTRHTTQPITMNVRRGTHHHKLPFSKFITTSRFEEIHTVQISSGGVTRYLVIKHNLTGLCMPAQSLSPLSHNTTHATARSSRGERWSRRQGGTLPPPLTLLPPPTPLKMLIHHSTVASLAFDHLQCFWRPIPQQWKPPIHRKHGDASTTKVPHSNANSNQGDKRTADSEGREKHLTRVEQYIRKMISKCNI